MEQFPQVLAPVQGDELYLTVGASHSTSFLTTKAMCGVSNESLNSILENGWKWLILSECLEENFPMLPLLYSAALNSSNSAQVAATELECLATIIKYISSWERPWKLLLPRLPWVSLNAKTIWVK